MGWYSSNVNFWLPIRNSVAVLCALALTVPPVEARTKKGDKLLKLGQQAEARKDYDAALAYYDQAVATDPNEPGYILADQRMRSRAAEGHVVQGKKFLADGKLDEALSEFQKAFIADPSSSVALQEMRETSLMIKQKTANPNAQVMSTAERNREELEKRLNSLEGPPVLRPITDRLTRIQINNQPARLLYESVAKLAGINVLFDPSGIEAVAGKNFNLELNNVTLQEALNYVALETHSFWKPISQNAIFVTQESDPKRQEYQDEVVRVFYIQNASTVNEFQEIFNAVRTGSKLLQGIFSVASQNAIIARGPVDTMALVEKLVHDLDRPKPEVMIDVIVMAVNKTKTSTIGASLLGQGGLQSPLNFTPRSPTTTSTGSSTAGSGSSSSTTNSTASGTSTTGSSSSSTSLVTIAKAGRFSSADYSINFPSTIVQALMNDATTRILQRPQVRATDGGKASLLIGSSIPYVTGSLNSAVATPGAIPYATTQFQQVNVGTQIEFAPHVNGPEDISMHVKVELSNVLQTTTIAGVQQPIIGKQTDEADIRMKDGEVSVMGGLSDREQSATLAGVPGVTNVPILGYILGSRTKSNTDNEILIAMIPHIVRPPDLTAGSGEGVYAGTERVVRVERRPASATPPAGQGTQPGAPANVPAGPGSPLSPVPNSPVPGATRPATVPPPANGPVPQTRRPDQTGTGLPPSVPNQLDQNQPEQKPPQ
jgi:general secretion pathway protein D